MQKAADAAVNAGNMMGNAAAHVSKQTVMGATGAVVNVGNTAVNASKQTMKEAMTGAQALHNNTTGRLIGKLSPTKKKKPEPQYTGPRPSI